MKCRYLAAITACIFELGCTSNVTPVFTQSVHASSGERVAPTPGPAVVLASPGRIEGLSDTIEVGAAIDGIVSEVKVKEGQRVKRGRVLAEIDCPDLRASLEAAKQSVASFRQVRARLLRGSRDEERLAAEQRTAAAQAVLAQATAHLTRIKDLVQAGVMARVLLDEAQRDFDVAEARVRESMKQEELVKAPPVEEDVAKADADVRVAEHQVISREKQISKCTVRAPISGTILRVLLKPGESFSTMAPKPLFTIADLSKKRVRAEVDEKDVAKVGIGQQVFVTSDALGTERFRGKVVRVASTMGRRKTASGDPAEKADRDILEVMVDFEKTAVTSMDEMPLGLRVVVQFVQRTS